jgi:fumarate hydratase class II
MAKKTPVIPASTRSEKDTMGEMQVPAHALYGASTQRAVLNFPVSGRPVPFGIIAAYAATKAACAKVNKSLGRLDAKRTKAIVEACDLIAAGLPDHGGWQAHFPVDIFQTGSGTSTNMHVNMGQSSNDTFPTAMHVAAAVAIHRDLSPAVRRMAEQLERQAKAWDSIVKIGRTHLQDATPIRLGQEFGGYASQLRHGLARLETAMHALCELPLGGTAVGTGINCHEQFGSLVAAELSKAFTRGKKDAITFREASNHFEAQHAKDAYVEASGQLKTLAVSLSKIANDIRWLGSGPRCGIGELVLPAVQPGSSIMPGKVNPVICESLVMVACQVIGNDAAITYGGFGGVGSLLDLNVAMPMMAANMLESIHLLAKGCDMFTTNLLVNLQPDEARCQSLIEGSLAMCTSLVPVIGYDASAALAKEAFKQGKTVRQLAYETCVGRTDNAGKVLTRGDIDAYLNPWSMTLPGGEGSAGG